MRRLTLFLLIVYGLLTAYVTLSGHFLPFFTPLLSLLGFTFALLHGAQRLGWKQTLLLLGLTFGVSLLFESLGVATGLVYGPYHYTDRLGPKFLGLVPYLIPVAWFMMTYPAFVIAARVVPPLSRAWAWRLAVAALGALGDDGLGFSHDPMMVAGQHWVWEIEGAYFGIPLQNYAGWWLTVFVAFALFGWLGKLSPSSESRRDDGFDRLAVLSYSITGLSDVLVDLQNGLGGPGLAGLFAMLPWVLWSWVGRATTPQDSS
jgi:putative membrane protein